MSTRKVVLAVDASDESERAVTWTARQLAKPLIDRVVVLTCHNLPGILPSADAAKSTYDSLSAAVTSEQRQAAGAKAGTMLVEQYMKILQDEKVECTGEVLGSDSVEHLVAHIKQLQPDMVVIGSHGKSLLQKIVLGSVGDAILHDVIAPVVVVRGSPSALTAPSPSKRCVVVSVDESNEAEYAFLWALNHFCREGDRVVVLHVQTKGGAATLSQAAEQVNPEVTSAEDKEEEEQREMADQVASEFLLQQFLNIATSTSKIPCEGRLVSGSTTTGLVQELLSLKADAVVTGARSMGPISRTFMGSVSDFLAHNSPCPVIVAKSTEVRK